MKNNGPNPVIKWDNGEVKEIAPIKKIVTSPEGKPLGTIKYIPLLAGYAITSHRVQSQEFEKVILLLSPFCPNQVYTSLTRAISFDGLKIIGKIDWKYFAIDPVVLNFYSKCLDNQKHLIDKYQQPFPSFSPQCTYFKTTNDNHKFLPNTAPFGAAICEQHNLPMIVTRSNVNTKISFHMRCTNRQHACNFHLSLPLCVNETNLVHASRSFSPLKYLFCKSCGNILENSPRMFIDAEIEIEGILSICKNCATKYFYQYFFF